MRAQPVRSGRRPASRRRGRGRHAVRLGRRRTIRTSAPRPCATACRGCPAGGDHLGDLEEGVAELLLLADEGSVVGGDQRPAAPNALLAVGDHDRRGQEPHLHVLVDGGTGDIQRLHRYREDFAPGVGAGVGAAPGSVACRAPCASAPPAHGPAFRSSLPRRGGLVGAGRRVLLGDGSRRRAGGGHTLALHAEGGHRQRRPGRGLGRRAWPRTPFAGPTDSPGRCASCSGSRVGAPQRLVHDSERFAI